MQALIPVHSSIRIISLQMRILTAVDDTINVGIGHGLNTGDAVVYNNGGNESVSLLEFGTVYYVIRVDDEQIKLATTYQNASNGVAINLADETVAGVTHSLTKIGTHGAVIVKADGLVETVHMSGVWGIKFFGTQSGGAGIGRIGNDLDRE